MFFWDNTFLLLIPGLIIALWAQAKVKGAYNKWSRVRTSSFRTGRDVAETIIKGYGLSDITIREIPGTLTDNYDPGNRQLNLSGPVYGGGTVASAGIAAHEAGHALQHHYSYFPLKLRNGVFPVARFGSTLAFPIFFIGLLMGYNRFLMDLGILLFTGFVLFTVATLPVEFNASRRAVKILSTSGNFTEKEITGIREVLTAAALTYVASAAMAILSLLRLLILRGRRN